MLERGELRPTGLDHPNDEAFTGQVHGEGHGEPNRPLERRALRAVRLVGRRAVAVVAAPGVEQHPGLRMTSLLLLAHHQLPGMGGGTPVDPAKGIPATVFAGHQVVLAAERPALKHAVRALVRGDRDDIVGERRDIGCHGEHFARADDESAIGEPERVGEIDEHRSDREDAAVEGPELVAEPHARPAPGELRPARHQHGKVLRSGCVRGPRPAITPVRGGGARP